MRIKRTGCYFGYFQKLQVKKLESGNLTFISRQILRCIWTSFPFNQFKALYRFSMADIKLKLICTKLSLAATIHCLFLMEIKEEHQLSNELIYLSTFD